MLTKGDEYFGCCPRCGTNDGYLNIGGIHWFVCDEHKTRWCFGYNIFSDWRGETEADWKRNQELLEQYAEVTPVHLPSDEVPWDDVRVSVCGATDERLPF